MKWIILDTQIYGIGLELATAEEILEIDIDDIHLRQLFAAGFKMAIRHFLYKFTRTS